MTKIHKAVSDLLVQHSEQISRAMEIDETETRKLYYLISRILRKSVERINSKSRIKLIGFGIPSLFNKKKLKKRARSYKDKERHLENSLDEALKKIQKTDAKKMFLIIKMNMKDGPEKIIDYIQESITNTEIKDINGMKLLEGTVRKSQ